ncbi:MAG: 5-(carboxyamino)imidazole ribonucleotide synthase [Phycisphaerae bacterium]|nr:5-(carboxyamino)imidazole ribonucleotide synthase [Phycisphaerae bacterium]
MRRATIGVLGGGQLGRMLALAGHRLGLWLRFYDRAPDAVAGHVGELQVGEFTDAARLERFAAGLDVVTYEFENVPIDTARHLSRLVAVLPAPIALEQAQDRLREKDLFTRLGIATPPFRDVESRAALDLAVADLGLPAVLKTRRLGYDGKGQAVLRGPAEVDRAWDRLAGSAPLILESLVAFEREVSIIAARSTRGEVAFYPLVENEHRDGILRLSRCPAPRSTAPVERQARDAAAALMAAMDYAGVLTVEFFDVGGRLLANEMAPRVHNSGHWTIDGAATSQFENHLRAILGLPLGDCSPTGHAAMINLIGTHPPLERLAAIPGARVHLYGKEPRPGRKLGHVTIVESDGGVLARRLDEARRSVLPP